MRETGGCLASQVITGRVASNGQIFDGDSKVDRSRVLIVTLTVLMSTS